MELKFDHINPLVLLGDAHTNNDDSVVMQLIKDYEFRNCVILPVGDYNVGFIDPQKEKRRLKLLNKFLVQRNITFALIRGNHDNPSFFKDGRHNLSNIIFLPDYTVLNVSGKRILCVGGAISVDRKPNDFLRISGRTEGINYWKDEVFFFDEEKIRSMKDIDVVVTHAAPDFCYPLGFGGIVNVFIQSDDTLYNELVKEREELTRMYDILKANGSKLSYFFYGHYHQYKREEINETTFILLDIMQFYELR